jgi:hypothetical protein
MSCKNFEAIISDLAREQMLDATVREGALSHVEECGACAQLLKAERALTAGLSTFAASMGEMKAPASLEAALLAKFRERRAEAAAAQTSSTVVPMPQRASSWRRFYPQAVAAAVLLMFAVGGAITLRVRQNQTQPSQKSALASNSNRQEIKPASTATPAQAPVVETPEDDEAMPVDNAVNAGRGQKLSPKEVAAIIGNQRRPTYRNVPSAGVNESRLTPTSAEIATDFMPVAYGENPNELENGRIVRVEMPRSALAQFGLPVNMERANERIKADVLIGDDGMARAIRFVR